MLKRAEKATAVAVATFDCTSAGENFRIPTRDMMYLTVEGNYLRIQCTNGERVCRCSLKEAMNQLPITYLFKSIVAKS